MKPAKPRAVSRFFDTETEVITHAKYRTKTRCRSQYIYAVEQDGHTVYCARSVLDTGTPPIIKVLFSGEVIDLRNKQEGVQG